MLGWSTFGTLTSPNADQDVALQGLSHIAARGAAWCVWPFWKTVCVVLPKQNHLLPCDPAITFTGTYPEELKTGPRINPRMHVDSSFICSCRNLEATKKSFSKWMD